MALVWNLPKHLAHITWSESPSSQTTRISIHPHDHPSSPTSPYSPSESTPSTTPFFQCTIHPIPYLPSLPLSSTLLNWIPGIDMALAQPPLPEGKEASQGELPGTEEWYVEFSLFWAFLDKVLYVLETFILPHELLLILPTFHSTLGNRQLILVDRVGLRDYRESSRRGELVWVDMKQGDGQEGEYENFWPELGRWRLGIKLERGEAEFGVGERWEGPRYGFERGGE